MDTINSNLLKKEYKSFGVQANLVETYSLTRRDSGHLALPNGLGNVLTERNGQHQNPLISSKLTGVPLTKPINFGPNNLCVIGQKVEEISVFGSTVGIQVS